MNTKEREVQEAVGALKVDETQKICDIQYAGPKDRDPGFIVTTDGEQIPFTGLDDIVAHFADQVKDMMWAAFVDDVGDVIRNKVKHIEIAIRITHTDE